MASPTAPVGVDSALILSGSLSETSDTGASRSMIRISLSLRNLATSELSSDATKPSEPAEKVSATSLPRFSSDATFFERFTPSRNTTM